MTSSLIAFGPVPSLVAFRLPLSPRVPLVKLDTVIAARGENAHIIEKYVEQGRLRWVFNVAVKLHGMRDLRFWNREVSAFAATQRDELAAIHAADLRAVLNEILGDRQEFPPGDICLLLGIRRATLMRLRDELLAPGGHSFPRAGLERFLKRRLLQ
jgi:hypothetical protein